MTSGAALEVPEALQSNQYKQELQVAADAAVAAGELIRAAFSAEAQKEVQLKSGLADLVTATDKACEVPQPHSGTAAPWQGPLQKYAATGFPHTS